MRVGFSTLTMVPSAMTGTATYVRGLIREFSARGYGVELIVLTNALLAESIRSLASGSVRIHLLEEFRIRNGRRARSVALWRAWMAPRRLSRAVPQALDLLHYPLTLPMPRTRAPTVLSLHDLQHHDMPELFSALQRKWRRRAYDEAARAATTVMTVSEYSKSRIVDCLGVPPERVEVAYHGVDTERFTGADPEEDDRLLEAIDLPERFLFYPAALWPHKNHLRLLDALSAAGDDDLGLVLTGPASDRLDAIRTRARTLGLGGRVRHLGFVDPRLLPCLYRRATAVVFPSLYEGFGIPVVEAMAAGCPVAAASIPTSSELCGDAALMFDPHDTHDMARAIDRVAGDEELRARLRSAGSVRAARFTWQACAERHAAIYRRTMERARG